MKILIVKLGAMGDVLRTTPLLRALKRLYPSSAISWIVDGRSAPILYENPLIDRLWVYEPNLLETLRAEAFDLAINLDKEPEALDAIEVSRASVKRGFGWDPGHLGVAALNPASAYAVRLGIDDELKFRINKKTYQEISFEQAEIPYSGEEYLLTVSQEDWEATAVHLEGLGIERNGRYGIGLNVGSSDRFAGKRLRVDQLAAISKRIWQDFARPVVLLGGPKEEERNLEIARRAYPFALNGGTHHTIQRFAALVGHLGLVITGDTIALHVAIAMKTPVLVYFGSTCAQEIELYGRGEKIVSEIGCAPCYKRVCPIDEQCMKEMSLTLLCDKAARILGCQLAA